MTDNASNRTEQGTAADDDPPPSSFPRSTARRWIETAFPILMTLAALGYAADIYSRLGLSIYTEQYIAGVLALALPLAFLSVRADGKRGPAPWYDIVLALAAFAMPAYLMVDYPRLSNLVAFQPPDAIAVSIVLLALIVEAIRRTVGWTLVITLAVFSAYALWGHLLPPPMEGREVEVKAFIVQIALDPQGLLGIALRIGTTIVFAFVFLGQLLFLSGGSHFFTDLAQGLMGTYRGGSAKIAVTASAFFGSISGSAVSNVASTGVITIPLMRKTGYPPHQAGAIEAVASTGGQLMPPIMGVTAFVVAENLGRPYADIALAALIPALLYYVALLFVVDLEAVKRGIKGLERESLPRARRIIKKGWFFPLPFGVLIWSLFFGGQQPETAALYGAISLLVCATVFGYEGKRLGLRGLIEALRGTGVACVEIVLITAAAGLAIGILNLSGLAYGLTETLSSLAQGSVILLLIAAAVICVILGMGMPTLAVYVLLAALVAPAITAAGVDKMAAHLFVLYFGLMSMITPPIAIAAFTAATIANAPAMKTGIASVRFGWVAYVVPFLFVGNPALLMEASLPEILLASVTALVGVWLVSAGMVGCIFRRLDPISRLLILLAGLCLMVPAHWPPGLAIKLAGLAVGVLVVGRELWVSRRAVAAAAE